MNRNIGTKIAPGSMKEGEVYRFHSKALGEANLQFLGGSRFKVVLGSLQSQKDKKKKWPEGSELTLPNFEMGTFYELNEPGDVA